MGGRSVLLIPARAAGIDPDVLPQDYQRLVAIVREAAGPVTVRAVGEVLGLPVEVRGKLEPLRAKLNRLADHFQKRWYRDTRLSPHDRKHLERRMVADGKDAEVLHLNTTSEGR